jgi:polyhydroxyalkanoate depolymerase
MLYQAYQVHSDIMVPVRSWATAALRAFGQPLAGVADNAVLRNLSAAYELIARTGLTHARPAFGIDSVTVGNREVAVHEHAALTTPFGTLLRGTVRTMLPEHDVYITDWHNVRDVPLIHGRFGFDEYIGHLISFLEALGPGAHVVAVCQPCVAVLVAAAVMAQAGNAAQPRSMTLMAGPIDTRVNPTKVNELANSKPMEWFERNLIASVPLRYPGAFRRVYPGFVQLAAFMSMNVERHVKAHRELYDNLAKGEHEKAQITKAFYDEYFAVLDLTAEFYLETVRLVFQECALPLGKLQWQGEPVEPRAIKRTMLLTVEGERDDICAVGQTAAAHDLCTGLRPYLKRHHMQAGVGHYGVFSGNRWTNQIYPLVKNVILASE